MEQSAAGAGDGATGGQFVGRLREVRVVPVVTVSRADLGPPVARALAAGGLSIVEITLRSAAGLDAIAAASAAAADDDHAATAPPSPNRTPLVGAGTVTSAAEASRAIEAGARFVVSPGFDEAMVIHCLDAGVPVVPGVATPTEAMRARALGLSLVKVFPVGQLGGPAFVRALSAVFPDLRFLPTGGVRPADAADYLAVPSVAAVGGSWMAPQPVIEAEDWPQLTSLAAAAHQAVAR